MENKDLRPKVGVGILILKDGKVLLGKRKNSFGEGEYSFTGGHVEYMESFEECAIRETREECGIEIQNLKFLSIGNIASYKPKHFITILFTADWKSGEPQNLEPDKIDGWDWYDIDNLPKPMFAFSQQGIDSHKTGRNYFDIEK